MSKVDINTGVLCLFSFVAGLMWRIWCHSHFRVQHPADAEIIEKSDERFWTLFLDYPLSECRSNSLIAFLYRTGWRGGTCRDGIIASWIDITADVVFVTTAVLLLIRLNQFH